MTSSFPRIPVTRKTGQESFTSDDKSLGFDLLEFWQWSMSDLITQTERPIAIFGVGA
jgi:hypothetical protein